MKMITLSPNESDKINQKSIQKMSLTKLMLRVWTFLDPQTANLFNLVLTNINCSHKHVRKFRISYYQVFSSIGR